MSRVEQNRQLNALKREVQRLNERLRALELDVEPGVHISEGFERLEADNERIFHQLDQPSENSQDSTDNPILSMIDDITAQIPPEEFKKKQEN